MGWLGVPNQNGDTSGHQPWSIPDLSQTFKFEHERVALDVASLHDAQNISPVRPNRLLRTRSASNSGETRGSLVPRAARRAPPHARDPRRSASPSAIGPGAAATCCRGGAASDSGSDDGGGRGSALHGQGGGRGGAWHADRREVVDWTMLVAACWRWMRRSRWRPRAGRSSPIRRGCAPSTPSSSHRWRARTRWHCAARLCRLCVTADVSVYSRVSR